MSSRIRKETFSVTCPDGVVLRGMLIIPEKARALVQFNGGTGLRKEFYLPFLEFLAEDGFICCLWDYRGSGESRPETLKGCAYTFSDYGIKDMPVIKEYLVSRFSGLPLFIVAHSVGGQQLGFMEDLKEVRGLVAFSVSTGYFWYMPWRYCLLSFYFFYIFTPLSIAFTGYIASKRFGYMEDLPKNVVREWRSWCWKPDYFFNKKFRNRTVPEGIFDKYTFPAHYIWTTDDPIANKQSVPAYLANIQSSKPITVQKVVPSEYGVKETGHMGFFKRAFKTTIWQDVLNKLNEYHREAGN